MNELTTSDMFKYLLSGAIILGLLYFCTPNDVKNAIEGLGPVGTPMVTLAVGSVWFLVYKTLIYHLLITKIRDRFRRSTLNWRMFLCLRFSVTPEEARLVWSHFRDKYFKKEYKEIELIASGIHLLNMSGIFCLFVTIWQISQAHWLKSILLFSFSILFLCAACEHDNYHDSRELLLVKTIPKIAINKIIKAMRQSE